MRRILGLGCVLSLALAAQAASQEDGRSIFDGSGAEALRMPEVRFQPSQPPAAAAQSEAARPSSDLYYFSPEEAEQAAESFSAYSWKYRIWGKAWTFDSDVPAQIQAQMRADLAFIKGIRGKAATPLHQEIFGAVDGAVYTDFFDSRVSAIGMDGCGNGNAVACVIPVRNPSRMWLTENFVKFDHPQIARMMVVFHEARHTEVSHFFWGHARCPKPFKDGQGRDMKSIWTGALLAGEPACDKTPKGSYGSSAVMLKNIQKNCSNCTAKVRMDAGLFADDQLGRITDPDARRQMEEDFNR
ncbi:MAG: hypothetical protein HY924_09650 [Elusimicrobia bacterium]|nr:hypothetical protein [Elusimicrobiota bacterium]